MKKNILTSYIFLVLNLLTYNSIAQKISLENLLDSTITLSKNGNNIPLTETIKSASTTLKVWAHTRGFDMQDKLLYQVELLNGLIPIAEAGNLKTEELNKVVNTIKLLVGINQINNLLSEGKNALLGNAKSITSSINLLQIGKVILDSRQQNRLGSLLDIASKTVKKLDEKDSGAKMAASSIKNTLEKIVNLVKDATKVQ